MRRQRTQNLTKDSLARILELCGVGVFISWCSLEKMRANPYESPPLDALPTGRRKTIYWPSWFWSLFVGFTFVSCVNATITWTPPYSMMAPAVSVVTGGAALIFAVLTVYKTMRHHQSLWKRWD